MTLMIPFLRIILQFLQIFLTDALTFMVFVLYLNR